MSTAPAEIAGIGSTQQKLRVSPVFDPLKAAVGPEEYFVLSRIDGTQTLREVLYTTGLPMARAVQIVTRLRELGALLLPGETAAAPVVPPKPVPPAHRAAASPPPSGVEARAPGPAAQPYDLTLPNATRDELAALAEVAEVGDTERRRILAMERLVGDPWALLGVPRDADALTLKRAYFQLSKLIHPDRHYGKKLGSFATRLPLVFEATSRAYARLTGTDKARGGASDAAADPGQQPQTPQEYAAELFDRACQLEVGGDALGAMKLFAAAVRVAPQIRYLRRATSCALAADQPKTAVEYAKKAHTLAPHDPSSARLLAAAFRAAGKLNDAEEVLVMAMALKSENDVLTAELRNDLADVRRQLGQT